MDTSTAKTATAYLASALLIYGGLNAILNPVAQSEIYGIPVTAGKADYVPVMGARNLAFGLAIGTLIFRGETRAAGTVLSTALVIGALDTWFTWKHVGRVNGAVWSHIIGDSLFATAGAWLSGIL